MTFYSDKIDKPCKYCGKVVKNLAAHIINQHPNVLTQLEEPTQEVRYETETKPQQQVVLSAAPQQRLIGQHLSDMIKEKMDIMLNILIMEKLSKSNNTSLQEISQAINPTPQTSLKDLKEFHDIIYKQDALEKVSQMDTGNDWANVALQAIPIIKDMLPKAGVQKDVGETNTRVQRTLKPIQCENTGSARESASDSTKSATLSDTGK